MNMRYFHGENRRKEYFEGWYFKQTGQDGTIALIPAYHVSRSGDRWASLQVVTETDAYYKAFPKEQFSAEKKRLLIRLDRSRFSQEECRLELNEPGMKLAGYLEYEDIRRPAYDIMGPFRLVPYMECRHSVFSLYQKVSGWIRINGKEYQFQRGNGYIEGDRGRSFPREYCWTQGFFQEGSIMLSVGKVPFLGGTFWGCTGFIFMQGQEYRIASYLGAHIRTLQRERICIEQGSMSLEVSVASENPRPLKAPNRGEMERIIHESPACRVVYRVKKKGRVILEVCCNNAGFEWDIHKEY